MIRLLTLVFVMLGIAVKAQLSTGITFYKNDERRLELTTRFLTPGNPKPILFTPLNASGKPQSCVLKIEPAPLAFFCRMEDRFRNNFHVFLKIRMGDDESYMKMIGRE